jgi:DNA-binding transcriptional regulator YiaG
MSDRNHKTPLWQARERTGLSRETVSRLLDPPISSKTLERMERGEAPLKGYRLKQLAVIYEVPLDDLETAAA